MAVRPLGSSHGIGLGLYVVECIVSAASNATTPDHPVARDNLSGMPPDTNAIRGQVRP
jgi:hypothetical protein